MWWLSFRTWEGTGPGAQVDCGHLHRRPHVWPRAVEGRYLWRLFSDASVFLGSTGHQLRGSGRREGFGGLKREESSRKMEGWVHQGNAVWLLNSWRLPVMGKARLATWRLFSPAKCSHGVQAVQVSVYCYKQICYSGRSCVIHVCLWSHYPVLIVFATVPFSNNRLSQILF